MVGVAESARKERAIETTLVELDAVFDVMNAAFVYFTPNSYEAAQHAPTVVDGAHHNHVQVETHLDALKAIGTLPLLQTDAELMSLLQDKQVRAKYPFDRNLAIGLMWPSFWF